MKTSEALLAARKDAGISQRELARRARMAQPTIAKIEAGHIVPRVDTFDRLLDACGHRLVAQRWNDGVDASQIRERLAWTYRERLEELERAANDLLLIRGRAKAR